MWNVFHLSLRFQFVQGQKSGRFYETTLNILYL